MNVIPTPQTLPQGFCPATYQDMLNGFSQNQIVVIPDSTVQFIVQTTPPSDTTKAWLQIDTLGRPTRIYFYGQGHWLSLHPLFPNFPIPWFAALPSTSPYTRIDSTTGTGLGTFDGGDSSGVGGLYSGPMWEVVTEMAALFPLAAGSLPDGTSVTQGATGGEQLHKLLPAEGAEDPNHTHATGRWQTAGNQVDYLIYGASNAPDSLTVRAAGGRDSSTLDTKTLGTIPTPGDYSITAGVNGTTAGATVTPHNTMPPYLGMNWIRRTQRLYYVQ